MSSSKDREKTPIRSMHRGTKRPVSDTTPKNRRSPPKTSRYFSPPKSINVTEVKCEEMVLVEELFVCITNVVTTNQYTNPLL
jgi:hypothetical protein